MHQGLQLELVGTAGLHLVLQKWKAGCFHSQDNSTLKSMMTFEDGVCATLGEWYKDDAVLRCLRWEAGKFHQLVTDRQSL